MFSPRKNQLTHTPHVNGRAVLQAEDDFRAAIEARLDVGVDAGVRVAWASKVYHFDGGTAPRFQQDVFLKSSWDSRTIFDMFRSKVDIIRRIYYQPSLIGGSNRRPT